MFPASDSDRGSQVPGFTDHLGERFIVPQPSGSLLEHLYFRHELSLAPLFEGAVKERVTRLANFRHSSYTRVRRFQREEDGGRLVLVSGHVPGRRLSEILQIMGGAGRRPPTPAVLALSRQLMTSVALLHDYGPDIFHGAIGPERLVLPGDGRVVVCEYVLGTAFEAGVGAVGVAATWRESRVPMIADTALQRYGRRVDLLQIGLVTLACLLGRALTASEFPDGIPFLVDEVHATSLDGSRHLLPAELRRWLAGLLLPQAPQAFKTLVEAQKALASLLQEVSGIEASPAALQAFVEECESQATPAAAPGPSTAQPDHFAGMAPPAEQEHPSWHDMPAFHVTPEPTAGSQLEPFAQHDAGDLGRTDGQDEPRPEPVGAGTTETGTGLAAAGQDYATADRHAEDRERPTSRIAVTREPAAPNEPASQEPGAGEGKAKTRKAAAGASTIRRGPGPGAGSRPSAREMIAKRRRVRIAALLGLVVIAGIAAVVAPFAWSRVMGQPAPSGLLIVESDPPGAEVLLDGQEAGRTPIELRATAGVHKVEVGSGGASRSADVGVTEGATFRHRVELPDAAARGGLRVTTNPPGGKVTVDGGEPGVSPFRVANLKPGAHRVTVEGPFGPHNVEVVVKPGEVIPLEVHTVGWLKVKAPFEVQVTERGRVYGSSKDGDVMVPAGRHHFDLVNAALGVKSRYFFDVPAGAVIPIYFDDLTGMLNLSSDEPAEVWLDGKEIGQTPLVGYATSLGQHEVVFRHPRLGDVSYTVLVTLAAPVRLAVTFNKK